MPETPAPGVRPPWKVAAIVLVVMVVVFAVLFVWETRIYVALNGQTLEFPHAPMVGAGIPCLFCHTGAINSFQVSLPSTAKCLGCHPNVNVSKGQDKVQALLTAAENKQPLRWIKRTTIPDFVYFSHERHVSNGVACETCHGPVGQMEVFYVANTINMGFCVSCHRQQTSLPKLEQERLLGCSNCHK
jgi:hypothetical protein